MRTKVQRSARESGRQVQCSYNVAGKASALHAGSDIPKSAYCSPCHRMPCNSTREGSKCVSMTWRVTSARPCQPHPPQRAAPDIDTACHVIGCHSTQETSVRMCWMTWKGVQHVFVRTAAVPPPPPPHVPHWWQPHWQRLTLVHFPAHRKRFLWDRGCIWGLFRGCVAGARGY